MKVVGIDRESASVISIRLTGTDGDSTTPPLPGQFLTLRLRPTAKSAPLLRSYSLSGAPDPTQYRISVKLEPEGAASGFLHTRLRPGDILQVGAPRGTFVLHDGQHPVVLISAGVGATPVLAMLHALAAARSDREVWWLHGARNEREHAFRDESARLLSSLANAHRLVCYSNPDPGDKPGNDFDRAARLDASALDDAGVPLDAEFYVCGPAGFMHDIGAALASREVSPDRVRTEIFGPAASMTLGVVEDGARKQPHPPEDKPGSGPLVSFARSNLAVAWNPEFGTLLEFTEACDVPVRWSCRTGVCHTCETGLVSGPVAYTPDPLEAPAPGYALICCARPQDDAVVLDLYTG
ncbi:MAG TPA: 2Fe-2S iron-sulfur cluster-binding protein [Streptosporangiaceae bacterium]